MEHDIMVSINCTAFNHEKYISDAIESFLMQKTNFAYEILIHDDASTDRTQEIIKHYESKYPGVIKPIYQKENQYSQGVKVLDFNIERARGKYIAICEGDDYWTDPDKLQKQVDYMEKHPECSMCAHTAYIEADTNKKRLSSKVRPNCGNKIYTVEEVLVGGGGLFATSSILYPAVFSKNMPRFYGNAPVRDYPLAIYLALQGTVFYMDELMSVYRVEVSGSWSSLTMGNIDRKIMHYNKISDMLDEINQYSAYEYEGIINHTKKRNQFNLMLDQGMFKEAKQGEFKEIYDEMGVSGKTKIFIKQYFPSITQHITKAIKKI